MATEDSADRSSTDERTARTVGQIVKYSREVNQSETVGQVGSYALEAAVHVLENHPTPTVVELAGEERRVLETMAPDVDRDGGGGPIVEAAHEARETVIVADEAVEIGYESDDVVRVDPSTLSPQPEAAVSVATPSFLSSDEGDVGVILLVQWSNLERVESYHVKPVAYLGDHVATAIANIRSRERLERARNDLAKRKEMVELYDRLLRHDLGNDLQIIAGFSDALVALVDEEDEELVEYANKIQRTAGNAADLIGRVGDLVKTLEREDEPEARDLAPILADVVADARDKFDALDVEFDQSAADQRVFAGDLIDSVFTNVVSNAAVHNDGPVTVRISVEMPNADTVVVGFADDGSGIAPEVRDGLFEMGEKGPESDGSGFGLGFVRALTESYGGSVSVGESEAGGADFRVALPRAT
jgi:signal transduction histidine kinase